MDKDYNPDQGLPNPESADTKDTGNGEWTLHVPASGSYQECAVIGGLKASLNNDGHSDAAKSSDK